MKPPLANRWLFILVVVCGSAIGLFVLMRPSRALAQPDEIQYSIGKGNKGALTIFVSNLASTTSATQTLTLPMIQQAVQAITTTALIENQGPGVWLLNASLTISGGLTLTLQADTVTWLKLRSNASISPTLPTTTTGFDYNSFASVRGVNSAIVISSTRITSWDTVANSYDTDIANGRSYVIAREMSRMDILNSDMSYLGSSDSESYGISWRDDEDFVTRVQTRVTGHIINSTFGYNYFGIYTYQAADMVFRGNKFHHNIGYGFDPHDFSHHFIVEDNEAYENGDHGFIVSRGCHHFVFRRNKSYNNVHTQPGSDKNAQGFMLDPGGASSVYPQASSNNIVLEDNFAWGNDGYGMRVIAGYSNTIQNNVFTGNLKGISLEETDSYSNTLRANTLISNTTDGMFLLDGAHANLIENNTIANNGQHGVYFRDASYNRVISNTLAGNAQYGIRSSGLPTTTLGNTWLSNSIYGNVLGGVSLPSGTNGGIKPPLVFVASASLITGTTVPSATIEIFSGVDNQGRAYEGAAMADVTGRFSFSKPQWRSEGVTVIATDLSGNSSAFSKVTPRPRAFLPLVRATQP